jgi:hypothetical protein
MAIGIARDSRRARGLMKHRWIGLAFVVLLILPELSRGADDLPARISDSEFWQLITEVSEPNGRFQYENFVSNEYSMQSVIPLLKAKTKPGGVFIGVGPEQNFTYIAALHPKIAFIIDIRRQNLLEHLIYKAIFELSQDRAEFISFLFSRKRPAGLGVSTTAEELFKSYNAVPGEQSLFDQNLERIIDHLTIGHEFLLNEDDQNNIRYVYTTFYRNGPALDYTVGGFFGFDAPPTYADLMTADDGQGIMRSFLASEENFQTVKTLQDTNLVIPVVGDFAGAKAVREVGRYLTAHHAALTVFYLSNVERYLFDSKDAWRRFYANVAILPYDAQSLFIRSIFDAGYGSTSKLSGIDEIMTSFSEGRILKYTDVIQPSH